MTLQRYLNVLNDGRSHWRYYRWFYATRTLQDMPIGDSGCFIMSAGFVRDCHKGWFYVASTETKHKLVQWQHWEDCAGITHNYSKHLKFPISSVERKLGRDPFKWVKTQSSSNPEDWVVPKNVDRRGMTYKKVLTTEE